jgi:hypothetical protein
VLQRKCISINIDKDKKKYCSSSRNLPVYPSIGCWNDAANKQKSQKRSTLRGFSEFLLILISIQYKHFIFEFHNFG